MQTVVGLLVALALAAPAMAEHLFGPDELDTTYGLVERVRQEIWTNAFDLGILRTPPVPLSVTANRNFFRFKTSAFTKLDYDKKAAFYLKLTNEAQYYLPTSDYKMPFPSSDSYFYEDEIFFDNLYADLNLSKMSKIPVDFRIGRQDFLMTHGEGFLIMDGTPGDGSRSFFFNSFKANVKFDENNNLDLIYITDQETDRYLPVMYTPPGKRLINSSDEQGVVVYSRNKLSKNISIEPYYMWKKEEAFPTTPPSTPELTLNTFGMRAVAKFDSWTIQGEFAYQFGDYDDSNTFPFNDREGYGGYLTVGNKYENVTLKPEWELTFVYLSGDDPDTKDKSEAWNPLFSRWPKWSELFVFTLVPETTRYTRTPAYWTNMQIYRANVKLNFTPSTSLWLWYNYLRAAEETSITTGPFAPMFSNDSKERGHLPQIQLNHKFSKNIDGYVLFEWFFPGDFYADSAHNASFFRWQLQFKL
jgi:hypothetical protein